MRVLHIIPSLDKEDGGPSVALPIMAEAVADLGVHVDVATTLTKQNAAVLGIPFGVVQHTKGYGTIYFPRQTRFYKISFPLVRWLRKHAREYDLIHIHGLFSFAPVVAGWCAKLCKIPFIIRPLGVLQSWGMKNRKPFLKMASFSLIERPLLESANAIHYTSQMEAEEASRLKCQSDDIVIPLAVPAVSPTLLNPELFYNSYPHTKKRKIILFLSRIDTKKGLELLIDAFATMPYSHERPVLVIAGSGNDDYVAGLKLRCSKLNLADDLIWTGHLDSERKLSALTAAHIFVLPSQAENFAIALLEAMNVGKACITTPNVALASEPVTKGCLCVVPEDSAQWAQAMAELLLHDNVREMLGRKAQLCVKQYYSVHAMARSLLHLYRNITKHHNENGMGSTICEHADC